MAKTRKRRQRRTGTSGGPLQPLSGLLALAGLLLMLGAAYLPVLEADYIWDDRIFMEDAQPIQEPLGVLDIWGDPRQIRKEAHYWPLVYSTFWLEHRLWGFNPLGSHLVNLLLHAGVCVLLWGLLRRLQLPGAWLAAALFALHPVHVEAVAWSMARKDLLAALFYLLAAGCWLRFRGEGGAQGSGWFGAPFGSPSGPQLGSQRDGAQRRAYLWMLLFFVAGMMSKSMIITLPAALLIWCWWQRGRIAGRDIRHTLPLFVIGFALAAADLAFYHDRAVINISYSWLERPLIAAKALWFYAGKLLWPQPLMPIYPKWDVSPTDALNWLPLLAGLLLLAGLWFARHRIGRGPLAGVLLFAVILSPMLGLGINVFMEFSFAADRYQYLASATLITLAVSTIYHAKESLSTNHSPLEGESARQGRSPKPSRWGVQTLTTATSLALLLTYGALTHRHTHAFQNDAAFWSYVVSRNPQAHSAYYNLGLALVADGQVQEGVDAYYRELGWQPGSTPDYSSDSSSISGAETGTFINLSFALLQLERFEEAALAARRATELDPNALLGHQNLASALHRLGRYEETLTSLQRVTELMRPPTGEQYYLKGHIATLLGRTDQAVDYLQTALTLQPDHQNARGQMRETLLQAGRYDAARRFDPALADYLSRRGNYLFTEGDYEGALQVYRHLVGVMPENAHAHSNLGSALAQLGRMQEAVASFERALAMDPELEAARRNLQQVRELLGGADDGP